VAAHQKALTLNPSFREAVNIHLHLAILYMDLGRREEARAEAQALLNLLPEFSVDTWGDRTPIEDRALVEKNMAALREAGLP
jgi:hypothetical protein